MTESNIPSEKDSEPEENPLEFSLEFVWKTWSADQRNAARKFGEEYLDFLRNARTERERVDYGAHLAERNGFRRIELGENIQTLKPGEKVYWINRGKNIALAVIGSNPVTERIQLIGAHLDTPRIDLKIRPLYEDSKAGVALMKTHYYGGLKKYQWATVPLALTGVIIKSDGSKVHIDVGRDPNDPVFIIPDLLIHLSREAQGKRTTFEVIKAEEMNALVGALPVDEKKAKNPFKLAILQLLNQKYGIQESDFQSADLTLVSSLPPRFIGFDKSMIGAAGQDDGVCSYIAIRAILGIDGIPPNTMIVALFDKEEIGSNGNTGAESVWIQHVYTDLLVRMAIPETLSNIQKMLRNTRMISGDATAPLDPSFHGVHDENVAPILGKGVVVEKHAGSGGKYDSSDAGAEYMGYIRNLFNRKQVPFQIGSLGAVDQGGGGTIAKYFAESFNCDVVDAGPSVLNMHSPYEITHIADLYSTFLAYMEFLADN
jgi:aspartyl aminopeptidase